jgi:predicted HAD superfamily hydrolase
MKACKQDLIKVYSFDIFNTVFARVYADPCTIFLLVQNSIQKSNVPQTLKNNFQAIRINAARKAKKLVNKEEVPLISVYEEIQKDFNLNENQTQSILNLELKTEYESIMPIAWTINRIRQLRHEGKRVLFISDMYLPKEFIISLLQKINIYEENDAIYLSGEYGVSKYSGKLFQLILKNENCSPFEIMHYGDHPYADVFIPKLLGIKVCADSIRAVLPIVKKIHFTLRRLKTI